MADAGEAQGPFWAEFRALLSKDEIPESLYENLVSYAQERAVTYEEFYYLLSRYPFLDIHHPDGYAPLEQRQPVIIKAKSGWDILDYGDRLRTSPGLFMYGAYSKSGRRQADDDGDSGGGDWVKSTGTLVQQFADTAYEVIALAIHKGWPAAQVYSGFYGMIRAAWIAAESKHFLLQGFDPTVNDKVINGWVTKLLPNKLKALDRLYLTR
jgi:hypothetical protein